MITALLRFVLPILVLGVVCAPALVAQPMPSRAASSTSLIPPPPKDSGQVVFYRTGDIMGIGSPCTIYGDGYKISKLGQSRFVIVAAAPGRHDFTVQGDGTDTLVLEVEPDETQFVLCRIRLGVWSGQPDLRPSTEAEFIKSRTNRMVDDDDMGPGPGALRAREVAKARSEAALASESSN